MLQFEVILKELGEIGIAQLLFLLVLFYAKIESGANSLLPVFAAYTPNVRCKVPPLDNATAYPNLTESDILNLTTPYDPIKQEFDGCERYSFELDACDGSLDCVNQSYPTTKCDQGYFYDSSLFKETVVTEFDLICDQQYLNSLSTSLYYVGMLIGSLAFGNFADLFGRKTCCIITYIGVLGCMFGVTFSHSIWLYIILRMGIAGFGYGTTIGTFVYTLEIVGEKWRTIIGMCYQSTGALGYMILGGIAYQWRDWHELMLVTSILSIPFLILIIIIPESPRWLFIKNKEKEGIKACKLMARLNKVKLSEGIFKEAKKASDQVYRTVLKLWGHLVAASLTRVNLIHNWTKEKVEKAKKYTTFDLFKRRRTCLLTLNVMFNWFVNSLVYYGLSLNAGALAGDIFLNNTLNGVVEIASYVVCIFLMDRIGRRILIFAFLFIAGICLIANVIINSYANENQTLITLGVVFAFAGKFGVSGTFGIIYNLSCELYPTVLRSNAIGIGSVAARIGGISAPYIILLQDYVTWLPNTIFGLFGLAAAVLSLWLPETNKHPMMETLEEAEEFYEHWKDRDYRHNSKFQREEQYYNETVEEKKTKL